MENKLCPATDDGGYVKLQYESWIETRDHELVEQAKVGPALAYTGKGK